MTNLSTRSTPRRLAAVAAVGALALVAAVTPGQAASDRSSAVSLTGAGSTLVAPLVSAWGKEYSNASITYGPIGSGGGITQISARTVDFGASDAPMTADQQSGANKQGAVVQIPWALAATVVSFNVPGPKAHIHLTGPVLAQIFLGTITNWNDPAIKKLNPKAPLPNLKITPVYRSDGSGDTYVFTDYLTQVNASWRANVGNATQVQFPTGVGAKGNDGVAGVIKSTSGAIGYVSLSYDFANALQYALIQNHAGQYVAPSIASITEASKSITNIPASNAISLVNPGKAFPKAYPMSTFTYALVPVNSSKGAVLKDFLTWAITSGQTIPARAQLAFAPLPAKIVSIDKATIAKIAAT
jgi:phosphate transport system substrate-binding protein